MALQFTAINGPFFLVPLRYMSFAIISLPTPVSPSIKTLAPCFAAVSANSTTCFISGDSRTRSFVSFARTDLKYLISLLYLSSFSSLILSCSFIMSISFSSLSQHTIISILSSLIYGIPVVRVSVSSY